MTAWLRQTRTALLAALIGATGLSLGAGCTSDDLGSNDSKSRTSDRSNDRYDDRPGDRSDDPRVPPEGVPRTARLVKRDFGDLRFRAPEDGTMWVVESTNNRVIYTDAVRRGDEFHLDPERNRGSLNDRTVIDKDIKSDIRHRIFFESDLRRSSDSRSRDDYRSGDTEWDQASDRARDRFRDSDLGNDRISRDPYRY